MCMKLVRKLTDEGILCVQTIKKYFLLFSPIYK